MFGRIIAFLLLVGLVAVVGTTIYNAGVTAGIAADVGDAIASGAPVPIGVYPGSYVGHPWGWGWGGGFFGILFGIFFLFLIFGLLRAAFGWGRWGGHRGWGHRGWGDSKGGGLPRRSRTSRADPGGNTGHGAADRGPADAHSGGSGQPGPPPRADRIAKPAL